MRRVQRRAAWMAAVTASIVATGGCCSLKWCQEKGQSPIVFVDGSEVQLPDVYLSKNLGQRATWGFLDNKTRRVAVSVPADQPVPFEGMVCTGSNPQTCVISCPPGALCRSGPIGDFTPPKKGYTYEYQLLLPDQDQGTDPRIIIKP